jgi:hypothetical protein
MPQAVGRLEIEHMCVLVNEKIMRPMTNVGDAFAGNWSCWPETNRWVGKSAGGTIGGVDGVIEQDDGFVGPRAQRGSQSHPSGFGMLSINAGQLLMPCVEENFKVLSFQAAPFDGRRGGEGRGHRAKDQATYAYATYAYDRCHEEAQTRFVQTTCNAATLLATMEKTREDLTQTLPEIDFWHENASLFDVKGVRFDNSASLQNNQVSNCR